jgi:DNA-binding CsgD family transcriptional regulator
MYLIHDITPFLNPGIWWFRSSVANKQFMCYQSNEDKLKRKDLLSNREKSVLNLIADGLTSKEIGKELFLSQHTIDNHRRRMFSKTGAVDSSALVHVAKLSGII